MQSICINFVIYVYRKDHKFVDNSSKTNLAHLNINSMKFKFVEIEELLNEKTVDLLFFLKLKLIPLSETAFLRYQATNLKDAIGTYMEEA